MGWAFGENAAGRVVGYSVHGLCDLPDCFTQINLSVEHCCGGMHDGGDNGCGGYFCLHHLVVGHNCPKGHDVVEEACVICDGPVSDTAGYRKIHGSWICHRCLDALDAPKFFGVQAK
jgi:hypothetical protein